MTAMCGESMKGTLWIRTLTYCSTCAGRTSLDDAFDTFYCLFTSVVLQSLY